jgi:hypothetical protein
MNRYLDRTFKVLLFLLLDLRFVLSEKHSGGCDGSEAHSHVAGAVRVQAFLQGCVDGVSAFFTNSVGFLPGGGLVFLFGGDSIRLVSAGAHTCSGDRFAVLLVGFDGGFDSGCVGLLDVVDGNRFLDGNSVVGMSNLVKVSSVRVVSMLLGEVYNMGIHGSLEHRLRLVVRRFLVIHLDDTVHIL